MVATVHKQIVIGTKTSGFDCRMVACITGSVNFYNYVQSAMSTK